MFEFMKLISEKCKFALLYQIVSDENAEIYTDNKNYFMARTDKQHPVWIWSKNDLTKKTLGELTNSLKNYLCNDIKTKVICDQNLYKTLVKNKYDFLTNDYFEMGTYFCQKAIKPKTVEGRLRIAQENDILTLAKFHQNNKKEIDKVKITHQQSMKEINDIFNDPLKTLYVWENNSKNIVCMAVINNKNPFARINFVYTPPKERCKGYAKNLIYCLTNIALKNQLWPILYTDFNYPASNKAYIDVGYESCGLLINFSCIKKDK